MIPKIRRPNDREKRVSPETKWVVCSFYICPNYDLCGSLGSAIRVWLWHCGVPAKIAFGWFKKKRNEQDK
jgi:hypothetical protein